MSKSLGAHVFMEVAQACGPLGPRVRGNNTEGFGGWVPPELAGPLHYRVSFLEVAMTWRGSMTWAVWRSWEEGPRLPPSGGSARL